MLNFPIYFYFTYILFIKLQNSIWFIRLEITKQSVYLGFIINKDVDNNYLDNNSSLI